MTPPLTDAELIDLLCWHDVRRPDRDSESVPSADCACDPCFYGRATLADEILQLRAARKSCVFTLHSGAVAHDAFGTQGQRFRFYTSACGERSDDHGAYCAGCGGAVVLA